MSKKDLLKQRKGNSEIGIIPRGTTSLHMWSWRLEDASLLKRIIVPGSVTEIGDCAFSFCESLESITVDKKNKHYCSIDGNMYSKDGRTLVQYAIGKTASSFEIPQGVTAVGNWAFCQCTSLKSITVPDGVTAIGICAFENCTSLTSIIIPNNVTEIGAGTFRSCKSLKNIVIPDSVSLIEKEAFSCCFSLASITIPGRMTSIGKHVFYYCTSLASIMVDEKNRNYRSIDGNLYTKDGRTLIQYAVGKAESSFKIPQGVTAIIDGAFGGCKSLKSITLPDSMTEIGSEAFKDCKSLEKIYIPNSVTAIGDSAFSGCSSLESIAVPDSVTSISERAFYGCESLKVVYLPGGRIQLF